MKKITPYLLLLFLVLALGFSGKSYMQTAGKRIITEMTWAAAVSASQTEDIPMNGRCSQIEVDVEEDTTGANTFTVTVATEDGGTLFTKTLIPDNGSTIYSTADFEAFLVAEIVTVTVDINDVPGLSGATVNVGFYIE